MGQHTKEKRKRQHATVAYAFGSFGPGPCPSVDQLYYFDCPRLWAKEIPAWIGASPRAPVCDERD